MPSSFAASASITRSKKLYFLFCLENLFHFWPDPRPSVQIQYSSINFLFCLQNLVLFWPDPIPSVQISVLQSFSFHVLPHKNRYFSTFNTGDISRVPYAKVSEKLDPDPHQSQNRIGIRIKVKIQELWRVKMDPWRAVDTQLRFGFSKWSHEDSVASIRRFASHWWETGSGSASKWNFLSGSGSVSKWCGSPTLLGS